jgi:hypothetical protein
VPAPEPDARLRISTSPDRSGSRPLGGSEPAGIVFVFWDHVLHPPAGGVVTFWIDDVGRTGPPHRVESSAPFDLEATAPGGEAQGLDVGALGAGTHTVTADVGGGVVVTATFSVP